MLLAVAVRHLPFAVCFVFAFLPSSRRSRSCKHLDLRRWEPGGTRRRQLARRNGVRLEQATSAAKLKESNDYFFRVMHRSHGCTKISRICTKAPDSTKGVSAKLQAKLLRRVNDPLHSWFHEEGICLVIINTTVPRYRGTCIRTR